MQTVKNEAGNSLPQVFTFNASNQQVRTVEINEEPFFVAKDVCDILQLTNTRMAVQALDDDERSKYCLPRQGETWCVNESGLYHLIFQSRKPEAKAFRKWVTSEVLPSLRMTGKYEIKPRVSIRYPQRGEGMTADVLDLLWLIGESLNAGDITAAAMEIGCARGTVSRVLAGKQRSSKVLKVLYRKARENRAADTLYFNPTEYAERLRRNEDYIQIAENTLPAVQISKHRGGTLGNKNACKDGGM